MVMLLRICVDVVSYLFAFGDFVRVSILVLVLRYSSQDAGGVVDVVVTVVIGIAVVDIADTDKRLRHGLLLYPAYYYPDSTSVANNNKYIHTRIGVYKQLDLPGWENHQTQPILSASASSS